MLIKKSCLIIFLLLSLTACKKDTEAISLEEIEAEIPAAEETKENICVYVCGAVKTEGVYELPEGSRCYEAIALAGGVLKGAATSAINQAEILEDEATIYIPTVQELAESEDGGMININTASKEELMTLPGVGESKAGSIIEYRTKHGGFQKIEDIMEISGIKEGMFEKIKDYIKV